MEEGPYRITIVLRKKVGEATVLESVTEETFDNALDAKATYDALRTTLNTLEAFSENGN